jgi:hypothetical protein
MRISIRMLRVVGRLTGSVGIGGPVAGEAGPDAHRELARAEQVQAALAEYGTLRAEITSRISAQDAMISIHVTAVAAIIGFALAERGSLVILLIVPPLSCAVSAMYVNHNAFIRLISHYIQTEIRPVLVSDAHADVLAWEGWCRRGGDGRAVRLRRALLVTLIALFVLPGVLTMGLVWPALSSWWAWLAWSVNWALLALELFIVSRLRADEAAQ